MAKEEKTITLNAPLEKVFDYWSDPAQLTEIWPSMVEIKDVQELPSDGHTCSHVFRMLGVRLEGTSEDIEYVLNERTVSKTKGDIESTLAAVLQPEASGPRMTLGVEYNAPIPALGRSAEAFILGANERELELMLANLKDRLES